MYPQESDSNFLMSNRPTLFRSFMDDFPILQFGSFPGPVPLTISVCQVAREKQRGYDVLLCGDLVEIFDETKSFDLVVAADVFELWQGLTD